MIEQKLRALVLSIRRTPTPIADIIPLLNEAATEVERLRAALASIAANTCCDSCREAALVAQAAIRNTDHVPEVRK